MADNFSYLSILNPGFATVTNTGPVAAGTFAYVSFLNPPGQGGGTTIVQGGSINGSTGDLSIVGGSNITVSNNNSTIEIIGASGGSAAGGVALSAGTSSQSTGTVAFVDGNGVSFGLSNGSLTQNREQKINIYSGVGGTTLGGNSSAVITGTQPFSFQALTNIAAYLNPSGIVQFAAMGPGSGASGTNAGVSVNSNGVSVSVPISYLTAGANITLSTTGSTVSIIGAAGGTGGGGGPAISASATSQSTGTVAFVNSNGVSFGLSNNGTMTASFASSNLVAGTGITLSTTGSTVSIIGKTDYMASNEPHIRAITVGGSSWTNGTVAFTGSRVTVTNSAGSVLIIADEDIDAVYVAGNTAGTTGTISSGTMVLAGGNGITLSRDAQTISIVAGNYLTTAAQVSHTHGNVSLSLSNISGTYSSASNGLTLSLTGATGGAGGGAAISASGNSQNTGTVNFAASNGVSFGLSNNGTLTASFASSNLVAGTGITLSTTGSTVSIIGKTDWAPSTHSHGNPTLALTNLSGTTASASNGFTLSLAAAAPGGGGGFGQRWYQLPEIRFSLSNLTNVTAIDGRPFFIPMVIPGTLSCSRGNFEMSRSTSGSNNFTVRMGVYTYVNATQLSLLTSFSGNFSNTATASVSGIRRFGILASQSFTLAPGGYVLGMQFSAGATASMNYSIRGYSGAVQAGAVVEGTDQYNTAVTYNIFPFFGRFTTTSNALPGSVGDSQVYGQFGGASAPIGAWIGLNAD